MKPSMSLENRTPTSTELASKASTVTGTAVAGFHRWLQGQMLPTTVTSTPAEGLSTLPLSSVARLLTVTVPVAPGDQSYVQFVRPLAACHVTPPSTEASTPPTTPPPVSAAVPRIVTRPPLSAVAPSTGDVIVELGATESVDADAALRPDWIDPGCTPMSANRLTVACCMRGSGTEAPRSWAPSRPHDHCTVPAPNTSALAICPRASWVFLR